MSVQTVCKSAGCSALIDQSQRYCTKHIGEADKRKLFDKARRADPLRKIYNTALWKRIRKYVLGRDPLCMIGCLCVERTGHTEPSTVVDHIKSIRSGGDPYDIDNLRGCCKLCHDQRTAREDSSFVGSHL